MARVAVEYLDTPALLRRMANPPTVSEEGFHTGILNLFEAVHDLLLRGRDAEAGRVFDRLGLFAEPLTRMRIFEASRLRVKQKHRGLSYADAAGYVTARELGAVFVTTDRGFEGLPGVRLLRRTDAGSAVKR